MEDNKKYLTFRIEGEFITQLAREQFHLNGRAENAIEILLSSTETDQLDENEKINLVFSILDGRAEIIGTYPDGDYRVRYLEEKEKRWDIAGTIERLQKEKEKAEKEADDAVRKLAFVTEYLSDWDKKKIQREYKEEYDEHLFTDATEETTSTGSALLDSFIKRQLQDTEDDYGWLEPNGTFHAVEWGEHQEWANNYVLEKYGEEIWESCDEMRTKLTSTGLAGCGDYLVSKGWVLLHNPAQGIAKPTRDESKRYTKAQKEFLYNYYLERDCTREANAVWEE